MTTADISPIDLEIIHNALTAAAAEMDVTVWRTSRSTIVRELLDYSTAIFDRNGWNVAQAARIPSHLNSMSTFLTEILANHIPPQQWQAGDVVISLETARRQAEAQQLPLAREVEWLLLHGMLHLLGYDDATEQGLQEMVARQQAVLDELATDESPVSH